MRSTLSCFVLSVVALCAGTARAQVAEPTEGMMLVIAEDGERELLPLLSTDVEAEIDGFVSRVKVRQTFSNPHEQPIEAIYVFPLPHEAAVSDMTITIDKRVIRADIQERAEARRTYERAKRAGKSAALLEQERPNIFTQSVANVMPGKEILVEISYDDLLAYEDGEYELVFPMVVGPRYIPGSPKPGADSGGGWAKDTNAVPDASRITPPVVKPGARSGNDISIEVKLNPGIKVKNLRSATHRVTVTPGDIIDKPSAGPFTVKLAARKTIPNKDFVLRWEVAGTKPQVAVMTHRDKSGGYFALMLQPPAQIAPADAAPKELVFVLDTSGSMSGTPISMVKRTMRYAISNLNPNDTFRIVRFSSSASALSNKPLRKTKKNVERALSYIDEIQANGGTEMLTGVREALAGDPQDGRLRMVLFLSDGYIGNETQIFNAIHKDIGTDTRMFTLGVGSSVNRYLIDGMAEAGAGSSYYALLNEPPEQQVEDFYERIADPVMTHVEIDWGDLDIQEVTDKTAVDLFVGQPLWVVGRYDEPGEGTVRVHGRVGKDKVSYGVPVSLPKSKGAAAALPQLWARTWVHELSDRLVDGKDDDLVAKITGLGLQYRIVTKYTSFVAVEDKIVNEGGASRTVQVPVDLPAGVSYEGVFGPASTEQQVIHIQGSAPTIDPSSTRNMPVPGRSYGSALGAAPGTQGDSNGQSFSGSTSLENAYYINGTNTGEVIAISGGRHVEKTLRLGGGLAFGSLKLSGDDGRMGATLLHLRLSRAVTDSIGIGARLSFLFPSGDADLLTNLLLELMYLPLFDGHLVLSAGVGAAMPTEGEVGLAYMAAAEVPFSFVGNLDLALHLRYDAARLFADDESLSSLGLGLALDW